MNPDGLARSLTLLGTAGLAYFYLLAKNDLGTFLALGMVMGSGSVQYTDRKPYVLPFILGMIVLIVVGAFFRGQVVPAVLGTAIGMGLPYAVFKLNRGKA